MRARERDEAVAALVRERGAALTRYAYLYTQDVAAAQDLVQDALVKVLLRTRTGFEPRTLEAYVRRTVATLSVDRHRGARARSRRHRLVARSEVETGHAGATEARVDLEAVLARLSPQERAVVVLRFYDDLTVPQTAHVMRLAEGTVKRYLSNALAKLEQHVGRVDPPAGGDDDVLVGPPARGGRS